MRGFGASLRNDLWATDGTFFISRNEDFERKAAVIDESQFTEALLLDICHQSPSLSDPDFPSRSSLQHFFVTWSSFSFFVSSRFSFCLSFAFTLVLLVLLGPCLSYFQPFFQLAVCSILSLFCFRPFMFSHSRSRVFFPLTSSCSLIFTLCTSVISFFPSF